MGNIDNPSLEFRVIDSEPSWVIGNGQVELAVTERGAHMAPVTFYRGGERPVQPYFISPLKREPDSEGDNPQVMRGDFFCMPFGSNATPYRGEVHPSHGETARSKWSLAGASKNDTHTTITLAVEPKIRSGKVTRTLSLVEGQNVVYDRTVIEGFAGKTTLAHHALLAMPRDDGALRVSMSSFALGMVCPYPFADPSNGSKQSLAIGAEFSDLAQVASLLPGRADADCSRFPARPGFTDLLQVWSDPYSTGPGWVAAVNTEKDYLWFALKDRRSLPSTLIWIENRGRRLPPWHGKVQCLGLEDGCMYFDKGVYESCNPNPISDRGFPTCLEVNASSPTVVNYIQGVVKIPQGYDRVQSVDLYADTITLTSSSGHRVSAAVDVRYLDGNPLHA
jgi:hypothetical protein